MEQVIYDLCIETVYPLESVYITVKTILLKSLKLCYSNTFCN